MRTRRMPSTQIERGRNVVIVTPTASGKTLCYNLPVLNRLLGEEGARAMYLFPTKALAEDQLHEFQSAVEEMGSEIRAFTYDGDTPQDARKAIRQRANVVLTNPDMLHTGILPHHTRWARYFENLRYIVIDELHYYRGVYGSHLANLLRRLKRICEFYGSKPQFICCSATIANPRELAEALTGEAFELVERNGAPRGEKFFIFYNPPVVNRQLGIRRSYIHESRRVALEFIERNLQTLVFANNRLATEVLVTYLKDACDRGPAGGETVRGYRGGYLPRERREIERRLREGEIRAVVATNALELGIDIGSLDAVVMAGYPGTIASSWQRAGPGGAAAGHLGGGAGGLQRAARSVHCRAPGLLLRALAGARLHQSREPRDPAGAPEVRGVRAAHPRRREVRAARYRRSLPVPGRSGLSAPFRRRLALDVGHLSGGRHQPALGLERQLRGGGHHRRAPSDRRGFLSHGADHAAREGDLPARSAPVPRGALRLRRAQGLREARGFATTTPTPSTTRR